MKRAGRSAHAGRQADGVVTPCPLPADTAIDRTMIGNASFTDACCVRLTQGPAGVVDIFFAVFGHHPAGLKVLLLVRHRVGAWFGLRAAGTSELLNPLRRPSYRVGEDIGPWPIFGLGESELIAGRDNRHLDFRLSVLKRHGGPSVLVTVSTVCRAHNRFGRMYLRVIAPFHRWGVRWLISRAVSAGRL